MRVGRGKTWVRSDPTPIPRAGREDMRVGRAMTEVRPH